jgi:cobyrinic acid a,c-diamide synthase
MFSVSTAGLCFSAPWMDDRLPKAYILYLSGRYPELYAEKLSANVAMRNQIASYFRYGGFT